MRCHPDASHASVDAVICSAAIVLCDAAWRHALAPDPFSFSGAAAAGNGAIYSSSLAASGNSSMNVSGGSIDGAAAAGFGSSGLSAAAAANIYNNAGAGSSSSSSVFALGAGGSSSADGDVLQLDALLLRVQLNLRSVLQGIDREQEVNIITEKVGTEQDTRFEDKARLPLGEWSC
jgi:hypothetical protein